MSAGLSIANNLLSNQVQLNLNSNQRQLQNTVNQLSSGLRINSAADDPSGLAIATNLQTQVDGFNQAAQNVQDANNAAQVALGALSTTTNILQRIRSLAVEASSDINSQNDRANLQAEISQLLLEINRISQNTNFNGQALLDGSHAGFQAEANAFTTITANSALASAGSGAGSTPAFSTSSATIGAGGGTTSTITRSGYTAGQTVSLTFDETSAGSPTISYIDNNNGGNDLSGGVPPGTNPETVNATADASGTISFNFGTAAGDPATTFDTFSTSPAPTSASTVGVNSGFLLASVVATNANFNTTVGTAGYNSAGPYATVDGSIQVQVINTGTSIAAQETFINSATGAVSVDATLFGANQASSDFENTTITLGNFSAQDVGTTAYLKISQNVAALTNPGNPAFNFQSGADEGDVIQVGIQATNTQTLRVSNINVAISASNNPSLGAEDAIGQIDNALQTLLSQQASLGAIVVRLNEDQGSANTAATNLQASESNIRDLNVGAATTQFTRLQILVQVGTSVLSQSNANAQSILSLFR